MCTSRSYEARITRETGEEKRERLRPPFRCLELLGRTTGAVDSASCLDAPQSSVSLPALPDPSTARGLERPSFRASPLLDKNGLR